MIINYHESEKLKEDYNISFMIDDFKDKNMCLWCMVTPENPHINIYHNHIWKSDKCARVSLLDPTYINAYDTDIDIWILNDKEKEDLISILSSKNVYGFKDIADTVFEYILASYNYELEKDVFKDIHSIQIPDYTKL